MTNFLADRLAALPFRRSANKAMKSAAQQGDLKAFKKALLKSLAKPRKAFVRTFPEPVSPDAADLRWTFPSDARLARAILKTESHDATAEELFEITDGPGPFEVLLIAEELLRDAEELSELQVAELYIRLASFQPPDNDYRRSEVPCDDFIEQLTAHGEAVSVASLLLEPLKTSKVMRRRGPANLSAMLADATDTDGMIHASLLRNAHLFLGSLVRVTGWTDAFRDSWASSRTQSRWEKTLIQAAAFIDRSGILVRVPKSGEAESTVGYMSAASGLADLDAGTRVSAMMKKLRKRQNGVPRSKKRTRDIEIDGSCQSDWAATAILRSHMDADADAIAISWHADEIEIGISCLGQRLLSGRWNYEIHIDGKLSQPIGDWVCTCWFQDDDVAFVELERGSTDGARHVRHVMLSLKEHLAVLTDTVTAATSDASVSFSSELSGLLHSCGALKPNPVTRELRGSEDGESLRLIPTWLEDDRVLNTTGEFAECEGTLRSSDVRTGGAILPLVLDWNPGRRASEADWTRLTVTEDREKLTDHSVAGFRFRIGRLQMLAYRSLRPGKTLRAVLGYNTNNETVYGRFLDSGQIAPLVMVEPEA